MIHLQTLTEQGRDFFEPVGCCMMFGQAELLTHSRREASNNLAHGEVVFAPLMLDTHNVFFEIRQRLLCHNQHPGVHHMSCKTHWAIVYTAKS